MSTSLQPTPVERRVSMPDINNTLWSNVPALGDIPGQDYLGRVIVEVWEKDSLMVWQRLTEEERVLQKAASALITHEPSLLKESPWTNEPTLGNLLEEPFLGRVVVEVWDKQTLISVIGNDYATLINRALQTIASRS